MSFRALDSIAKIVGLLRPAQHSEIKALVVNTDQHSRAGYSIFITAVSVSCGANPAVER
jgi:hypothetical protein